MNFRIRFSIGATKASRTGVHPLRTLSKTRKIAKELEKEEKKLKRKQKRMEKKRKKI